MLKTAQAVWKSTRLAGHVLAGVGTVLWVFPKLDALQKRQRIQAWSGDLLGQIGVRLVVHGQVPSQGPLLLVANHISWLDMLALLAVCPGRFVAKAEVRDWPLLGRLTQAADSLFVQRGSARDALRVVQEMAAQLQAGAMLNVFPEGTTSNGAQLLPFHANLFQAAIAANAPVMPVALRFIDQASGRPSLAPAYSGKDSLWLSIWRTLKAPPLSAMLHFGEPQNPGGRDRRQLARELHSAVKTLRQPG